jgi:heat shock protein HtpX
VNFVEQQRRNRQRTILLVGAFVALFAAVGLLVDLTMIGAPVPIATAIALLVATATSLLGWRRGADWVLASLLAEPLRDDDPEHRQLANIATEMALAAGVPCRASSSFRIHRRTRLPPEPRPPTPPSPSPPAPSPCSTARRPQGVVAHEMAHLANRDTAVMTMVSVLFGGLLMLADWARRSLFFARQGSRTVNPLALLVLPLLVLLTPLLSRLLAMAVSRRREYQADATAVEFTRNPEGLARALEKIAGSEFPLRAATRGSAHLFIISPLRRRPDEGDDAWAALFATHPPLAQRVALLRGLAQ